jgi:hypothetical protein
MKFLRTRLGAALAAAVIIAAITAVVLSTLSASKTTDHSVMPGMAMNHNSSTSTTASSGSMSGMQMSAMWPLQPGADGTHATSAGLTLRPDRTTLASGRSDVWAFHVTGPTGRPITHFQRDQTKLLHLIVVRDDLTNYQHLHPVLSSDGTFRVPLALASPGRYRAIADFTTGAKRYALGTTLRAPGHTTPVALPAVSTRTTVDGYDLSLKHPALMAGASSKLTFTITKGAMPVTALQPYLGAYGHLVALKKGTVAYSHVHPQGESRSAGQITFDADFPAAGAYRLFVQFRTGGAVHTGAFTVDVMR